MDSVTIGPAITKSDPRSTEPRTCGTEGAVEGPYQPKEKNVPRLVQASPKQALGHSVNHSLHN